MVTRFQIAKSGRVSKDKLDTDVPIVEGENGMFQGKIAREWVVYSVSCVRTEKQESSEIRVVEVLYLNTIGALLIDLARQTKTSLPIDIVERIRRQKRLSYNGLNEGASVKYAGTNRDLRDESGGIVGKVTARVPSGKLAATFVHPKTEEPIDILALPEHLVPCQADVLTGLLNAAKEKADLIEAA